MKLIQRVTLGLRQGSSDKVYIVELCEVGSGRYVVNFQFGRRGAVLQSGTKTSSPVREANARSIFARLVDEKKRKGYSESAGGAASASASASGSGPRSARHGSREEALVAALSGRSSTTLTRAVWRVGELKLRAAVPSLVSLLGSGSEMLDYVVTWALARCGDEGTLTLLASRQGVPASDLGGDVDALIPRLFPRVKSAPGSARLAPEALRAFSRDLADRIASAATARLPAALRDLSITGPAEAFSAALARHLEADTAEAYAVLEDIYRINTAIARRGLVDACRTIPMRPPAFRVARHLFKIAELRVDGEVFGILAHRFETSLAMFRTPRWGDRVYVGRTYMKAGNELKLPSSRLAYSSKTRAYLRRRVWRHLRRLARAGDLDYVRLAVGVLLPYRDADAKPVQSRSRYSYSTRKRTTTYWDAYAGYQAFNAILYSHSPRYHLRPGSLAWRCTGTYKPGDAAPPVREEAFPKLWDEVPIGLMHLLGESRCLRVHEFAVKALRANQPFCDELDVDGIAVLLRQPYEVTAALGYDLALARYRPQAPDIGLLTAMADAAYAPARAKAHEWIDAARLRAMYEPGLLSALILGRHPDTRAFGRRFLESTNLTPRIAEEVIARTIAGILALGSEPGDALLAREAGETLLRGLQRPLQSLGLGVIADLIAHPSEAVQDLGGRILLGHGTRPEQLPQELLGALLRSRYPSIRGLGARLLGELPERALAEREALLVDLILSPYADLRDSIRPVVSRLARADARFAGELSRLLIARLLSPESFEGLHSHILRVLRGELMPTLKAVPKEVVLRLLRSKSGHAQELGGYLLADNVDPNELSVAEVARLASHEILSVRQASWKFYRDNVARIRAELGQAIRIVDATWEDSRNFAFDFLRANCTDADLTPDVLVGLCDSVRADVQRFGQEMITRFFHAEQGPEYLLRLAEHPSADLQLFASNFLEDYAHGDLDRLMKLRPYFLGVLSRVNRGRVAKARVFAFLTAEALADRPTAEYVAELLIRQSLTIAIGDRAACVAAILEIHRAYPDLDVPLKVRVAPLRSPTQEARDGV